MYEFFRSIMHNRITCKIFRSTLYISTLHRLSCSVSCSISTIFTLRILCMVYDVDFVTYISYISYTPHRLSCSVSCSILTIYIYAANSLHVVRCVSRNMHFLYKLYYSTSSFMQCFLFNFNNIYAAKDLHVVRCGFK